MNYFKDKNHFEEDGTQNCLVFEPIKRYFQVIANTKYILSWKFKELSDKTIKPPATSDNSLSPLIDYLGSKVRLKFSEGCLKQQNKFTYTHRTIINIYIIYGLGTFSSFNDDPTLKNSLSGAFKLTKTLILISTSIRVMELDLIENQVFDFFFFLGGVGGGISGGGGWI